MIRNIFWSSITNILISFVTLFTGIMIARLLGPEGRGVIAAAQSLPSIFAGLASLGLSQATVYFLNQSKYGKSDIVSTLTSFMVPWSLVVTLACYCSVDFFMSKQSSEVVDSTKLCSWLIFNSLAGSVYVWIFQGLRNFRYWNYLRILSSLFWLMAILIAVLTDNMHPYFILSCFLIIPLPFVLICYIIVFRETHTTRLFFNKGIWLDMLKYGFPLLLTAAPKLLNSQADQLFISFFLTPKLLGFYAISLSWGGLSGFVYSAVSSVMFPVLARQGNPDEKTKTVKLTVKICLIIAIPFILLQALITPYVIPVLFGASYRDAVFCATMLVISGTLISLTNLLKEITNGLGKTKVTLYGEISSSVITFTLLYIFIGTYQLNAVIFTSIVSYSLTMIYLIYCIANILGISIFSLLVPQAAEYNAVKSAVRNAARPIFEKLK